MSLWIGKTLGKVHIEKLLGRGGMAEVYLGTHTLLQRPVAVKLLHGYLEEHSDLHIRFLREARVAASLRHPNIVQVFDFDIQEDRPYIVMEYVNGPTLSAYLKSVHERGGGMPLGMTRRIFPMLAAALDYAHQQGVVHRDIKPGNVLLYSKTRPVELGESLPQDVEPLLADFGLVRVLDSAAQTTSGIITGTPHYMSPEQARGERVDHRADVYSLGVLLYELLSGRVPFEGDTALEVMRKVMYEPAPPIPNLSPQLQAVLDRALDKNPNLRYQSAGELSNAFLEALGVITEANTLPPISPIPLVPSTPAPVSPAPLPAASAPARKLPSRSLGWGIGFLAVLVLAGIAWGARNSLFAAPVATGPSAPVSFGVLRFQDVAGAVDGVTVFVSGIPLPPEGNQYEVWLVADGGETRRSLGVLSIEAKGDGSLTFVDGQSRNLLGRYNRMEISLEPSPDPSPNFSGRVAFSSGIPDKSLMHIRHLLVSFSGAPNQIGLLHGLKDTGSLIDQYANAMLTSYDAGDEAATRANAEAVLNLIVGSESDQYGDRDGDGDVNDPGDSFGLLLNGDSPGYTGGVYSHAGFAMQTGNAPVNVILHGGHVQVSIQNVEGWAVQLRDLTLTILQSPFDESLRGSIVQAVALADQIMSGVDLDGNERVDPVPGEGGVMTAYEHAYYMADLTILEGAGQVMPPGPTPEVTPGP